MSHSMSQSHSRSAAYPSVHTSDSARTGSAAAPSSSNMTPTTTKKPSVFDLHPPPWRPRLHPGSRQLGAPDVYIRSLASSTAPEDDLSEANVKNGISARPAVGNETFSAHDMIYDRLKGKAVVRQLGLLFDEVVQRREQLASLRCGPAGSQYRQPQRVTLNEVKLAAYVKELADASVPLRKLARSVPHGYRGERMLDMLWNGGNAGNAMAAAVKSHSAASVNSASNSSNAAAAAANGNPSGLPNSVAIDRAVWFVRVVGASEISSSRLRQGNSAAYTTEWTGVLMGWLRRQIVELNVAHHHPRSQTHHAQPILGGTPNHSNSVPSSPANAARSRQTPHTPQATPAQPQPLRVTEEEPYALFLEDDFRDRWLAKWRYSVSLLRALRYESLMDVRVAAHATIDMLRTANVVQLVVVLALLQEFLDVVADSVTLRHFALDVLSSKLHEYQDVAQMRANESSYSGLNACKELKMTLLYIVDASPDDLISPSCWVRLQAIIEEDAQGDASVGADLRLTKAKNRNERLLFGFLTHKAETTATLTSERLRDVDILDKFIDHQNIHATFNALFRNRPASVSSEDKMRTILTWSTTQWRSGVYRTFAGARLIQEYVKVQPSRTTQQNDAPLVFSVLQSIPHDDQQGNRSEPPLRRIDVDAVVMTWITDIDVAFKRAAASDHAADVRWKGELEAVSIPDLIILIGELCQRDCFSFQKYLQRLTARGLTAMGGRSSSEADRTDGSDAQDSLHTKLLRSIPLLTSSAPLEHQRRTAIYGNRSKESWEEAMERRAVREMVAKFAFLTETGGVPMQATMTHAADAGEVPLAHFWASSRYVQSRVIHLHILPALRRQIESQMDVCASEDQFLSIARLLADAVQFAALREVSVLVADNDSRASMRQVARLTVAQHQLIWKSMDVPTLAEHYAVACDERTPKVSSVPLAAPVKSEKAAVATVTKARESLKAFQSDRNDEAGVVLQGHRLECDIALKVMLAAASEEEAASIDVIVRWWRHVSPSTSTTERSIGLCTSLNHVASPSDVAPWTKITTRLAFHDMISFGHIIDLFATPALRDETSLPASQPHGTSRTCLALAIVSAFLATKADFADERVALQIAYAQFIADDATDSISKVLQIVCHVANVAQICKSHAEQDMTAMASDVRQNLCNNVLLQAHIQSDVVDAVITVRRMMGSEALAHVVLQELLGSRWPWTSDQEVADRSPAMMQSLDALRWRQALCEVSIAVNALQSAHAAADMGAHGKLQSLARAVCSDILGDDVDSATATYTLSMLTSNTTNGPSFAIYLLEERVKRLGVQLEATFADETRMRSCLRSLLLLQRGFVEDGTSASLPNAAVHALRLVTEWMENNVSATPAEAGSTTNAAAPATSSATLTKTGSSRHWHREEDESLIVRLGTVCGLMQLSGLLATPSAKQLAPRLFCAILLIALTRSRRSDATEARLTPILDVATYILQQTPSDVQQTMQGRALERLATLLQLQPCPLNGAGKRIAALIDHDQDIVRPLRLTSGKTAYKAWQQQRTLLIEASSCSSAFVYGQFVPVAIKPWDLHPNVETLGFGSATAIAQNAADGTPDASANGASSASTTELAVLTNNGPISLQHFGAHRTLDRLPDTTNAGGRGSVQLKHKVNGAASRPPKSLYSEQSYGIHLAGESIYARDAGRGLLAMDDLGDRRRIDVKHLVLALQQPTPSTEGQAKRGTMSTPVTPNDASRRQVGGTDKAGDGKPGRGTTKGKETFTAPATSAAARKRKTSTAAVATSNEKKAPVGGARKRAKKD